MKTPIEKYSTILELHADTFALKRIADLEELVDVPPERGGVHFSDWERDFVRKIRAQHDNTLSFTPKQREKIAEIWHAVELRKHAEPEEKTENLFSKLSPKEQARQRERASKVVLPWEKKP